MGVGGGGREGTCGSGHRRESTLSAPACIIPAAESTGVPHLCAPSLPRVRTSTFTPACVCPCDHLLCSPVRTPPAPVCACSTLRMPARLPCCRVPPLRCTQTPSHTPHVGRRIAHLLALPPPCLQAPLNPRTCMHTPHSFLSSHSSLQPPGLTETHMCFLTPVCTHLRPSFPPAIRASSVGQQCCSQHSRMWHMNPSLAGLRAHDCGFGSRTALPHVCQWRYPPHQCQRLWPSASRRQMQVMAELWE